ncbi:YlbD family protein [Alkalicoccobacillus porphyridii]|uniref:Cytoplasmic protein n=1 Tax=Alkalicoccobacillus porphyridii TaxID=2597270 RepID=A0A553ZXW7_9BACI|nr:YlbD family protein [Alkalicoccobacillus porphyridii]TSB46300.1 hypothetical protein FN960_10840 [Alkalicoccobacillus porphyridii]
MVSSQELHPSVQEFKAFVREHPFIMSEVREGTKSLQDVYEEWSILGPDHEQWRQFTASSADHSEPHEQESETKKQETKTSVQATEFMGQLMNMVKSMNVQDLQNHLSQFSSVLGNVQTLIQSFQRPEGQPPSTNSDQPFSFRRD